MNYLKEQISYSTINLEFYQTISQEITAAYTVTWKDKFGDAMKTGWEGLITLVVALLYIWPILIAAGLIVIYLKLFRRKPVPYKQA